MLESPALSPKSPPPIKSESSSAYQRASSNSQRELDFWAKLVFSFEESETMSNSGERERSPPGTSASRSGSTRPGGGSSAGARATSPPSRSSTRPLSGGGQTTFAATYPSPLPSFPYDGFPQSNHSNDPFASVHYPSHNNYHPSSHLPFPPLTPLHPPFIPTGSSTHHAPHQPLPWLLSTNAGPEFGGGGPQSYGGIPPASYYLNAPGYGSPATSPVAGPSRRQSTPTSSNSPTQDLDDVAIAEDKRRRNTAASARFRVKKKERTQQLEQTVSDLEERADELEKEAVELRRENTWLKEMVIMKGRRALGTRRRNDDDGEEEDNQSDAEDDAKNSKGK